MFWLKYPPNGVIVFHQIQTVELHAVPDELGERPPLWGVRIEDIGGAAAFMTADEVLHNAAEVLDAGYAALAERLRDAAYQAWAAGRTDGRC